jgi:glutaminyl-peptide cyclotransferase
MKPVWLLLVLGLAACGGDGGGSAGGHRAPGTAAARPGDPPASAPADPGLAFDADSAFADLARQVAFGPRVPGTSAHRECGEWIVAELARRGARVERDPFTYTDADGRSWPLVNIVGHYGPAGEGRLLLVAHWDSRPWADQDPDSTLRDRPIPAANDGASGVAVLLEVARNLNGRELPRGVDLFFTDGEDLGHEGEPDGYCRGTRRFAGRGLGAYRRAVVLDMVGDVDLHIPVEGYSYTRAPQVVDWVWTRGLALSPEVFSTQRGNYVYDDHMPLLEAGLPAVDVIDFDYPYWHTHRDDLGAVSARSLGSVGRVVLSLAVRP